MPEDPSLPVRERSQVPLPRERHDPRLERTYARPMGRAFPVRGIVEGFYGTPWPHRARLDAISFLAPRGLNAYVYAPKDDAKHRADWRIPYDAAERTRFGDLATHARDHGARFGFAISPGLDITYESAADRAALLAKLAPLLDAGVPWFLLLLDDIPMQAGLAPRQAELATWLFDELRSARRDAALTLCPTEYVGTHPSPYLAELGRGLPVDVDVMWTGPTVCSPTLRAADARGWTDALGGHRTIVWDNTPVNDATMTHELHLGPYEGRDADLVEVVAGVLCNPMTQPRASLLQLATAMDFLNDPDGYEPAAAWSRACVDLAGERAAPLAVLGRACADGPLIPPGRLELTHLVDELEAALEGPDWVDAAANLVAELRAARALPEAFPPDDELGAELAPWAAAASAHASAGLAALRLIQQVSRIVPPDGEPGRAHIVIPPDPEPAMHHAFALSYTWMAARADEHVVYGPRFVVYSAVVQLPNGAGPALDVSTSLREDANVIDRLCRLALDFYEAWRREPDSVREPTKGPLPFRDRRLARA
jgi:hyaluronoglucosaminidase